MKPTWKSELPPLSVLLLMLVISTLAWPTLPERVPVHYGFDLQPDRWGDRGELLFVMPAVSALLYLVMRFLPRIDPGRANYETFRGSYDILRTAVLAFLAAVHVWMILSTHAGRPDPTLFFAPAFGVLLIVIGNFLGKVRPNWFFGVRTPWTLSSKIAWTRANRAGGWVMIATGVLLLVAAVIRQSWAFWTVMSLFVLGLLAVTVDSYFTWRADPDKVPPSGTTPAGS